MALGQTAERTPPLGDAPGAGRRSARDRGVSAHCFPHRSRAGLRPADGTPGWPASCQSPPTTKPPAPARRSGRTHPRPRRSSRRNGAQGDERRTRPGEDQREPIQPTGRARQDLAWGTPKVARPRRRRPRAAPANRGACREARHRRALRTSSSETAKKDAKPGEEKPAENESQEGRGSIGCHRGTRQLRRLQPQPRLHRLGEQGPHRSRRQRGVRTGGGCGRRGLGVRSARRPATEPARPPPAGEPRPEHRIRKQASEDANGRGGPGERKKSRGVAGLVLGVPIPDHVKGQPNPGRVKVTQERVQPQGEDMPGAAAEDRGRRSSPAGHLSERTLDTSMREIVRDYFLKTRAPDELRPPTTNHPPNKRPTEP